MENPQAFPFSDRDISTRGMTLRDYFAAKAMQEVVYFGFLQPITSPEQTAEAAAATYAESAYIIADAMLKARE